MKKKIIIFTSSGGGGHESASKALDTYLKDDYELIHTYIFTQVLHPLDITQRLTFGKITSEYLYNLLICKKYFRLLNAFAHLGKWLFLIHKKPVEALIKQYIMLHKPDIIISVIPYINGITLSVAQELAIPFILIPTDLDATNFVFNLHAPTHKNFWIITSFNDPAITKIIDTIPIISNENILIGGFPLRKSFFTSKDIHSLKEKYNIPENKFIVCLIMGAAGSDTMYNFVYTLHKAPFPLHLIIVLGRNTQLRAPIELLIMRGTISATLLDFTDQIADLMAISDLCITKSGSVSVCEALYSNLPLLLDATSTILKWENFNHTFIKKHGFGTSIESYTKILPLVEEYVTNNKKYTQTKQNLIHFEKKELEKTLKKLLDSIFKH